MKNRLDFNWSIETIYETTHMWRALCEQQCVCVCVVHPIQTHQLTHGTFHTRANIPGNATTSGILHTRASYTWKRHDTWNTSHKSLIYMETLWHVEQVTQEPNIHGNVTTQHTLDHLALSGFQCAHNAWDMNVIIYINTHIFYFVFWAYNNY